MTVSDISILEGQLQEHLEVAERQVRFVAQTTGFTLQIVHSGTRYTLFTQRGRPRVFKNLTLAADLLKNRGVKWFKVVLQQNSAEKGPKAKTVSKKRLKKKPSDNWDSSPDEE